MRFIEISVCLTRYSVCSIYLFCVVCLYIGVNKEEPELAIATEENQDEEPTKAKKRK